jgi:hypothetical protein
MGPVSGFGFGARPPVCLQGGSWSGRRRQAAAPGWGHGRGRRGAAVPHGWAAVAMAPGRERSSVSGAMTGHQGQVVQRGPGAGGGPLMTGAQR